MYFTYDTENFSEADYDNITALRGFSARESRGRGENNRGRIIRADRLIYATPEAVLQALPEGYRITESAFASSDGKIIPCAVAAGSEAESQNAEGSTASLYPNESAAVDAVKRTIAARGAQAGLSLLSSLTVVGILTKSVSVLVCMEELLSIARITDYAECNIFDIFQTIPKLRASYWEDEKKRDQLQSQFDKLICGGLRLSDVRNPFDRIYLKGLCELLHIELQ